GNDVAPIVGRNADGSWVQIRVGNVLGWVAVRVVRATGYVDGVPVTDTGAATTSVTTAPANLATISVPTGDIVNVRVGPSTRNRVAYKLRGGQSAAILGRNADGSWWQIRINGRAGWVNASVVVAEGDVSNVPVVP
ncbi:MAG: SH3 domain-containing protein, partial [Anaerolineae bacterium]|nr:SH3 domain-containing protein [Anaerolineae bacterium]